MQTTSVPKGPSKDLRGDRKLFKILQEGLRKQAIDTDRRFSQTVDQMAKLAGSMKQIGGLLRPVPTALGRETDPLRKGNTTQSP